MQKSMTIQIHESWKKELIEEFEKPYFSEIKSFLESEIKSGKTIYPHPKNIFHIFNIVPFSEVRVVILGQDPYHGPWQAHGMSFSVREWTKIPPSLRNIYKEISSEYDIVFSENWDLTPWAEQWVFLLNAILTVEAHKPASHSKIGWENFTDAVIKKISEEREGVVFLLWGNFARTKKSLINTSKHLVLESPHPSPFSAHSWFFGCDHFKEVNIYLKENWEKEIDWSN